MKLVGWSIYHLWIKWRVDKYQCLGHSKSCFSHFIESLLSMAVSVRLQKWSMFSCYNSHSPENAMDCMLAGYYLPAMPNAVSSEYSMIALLTWLPLASNLACPLSHILSDTLSSHFGNPGICRLPIPVRFLGYMEEDLMKIDLKSIFRAISSLENWIMI